MTYNYLNTVKLRKSIIVNIDVILLVVYFALSIIEGVIPELFQIIILIKMGLRINKNSRNELIQPMKILFILFMLVSFFIFQIIYLDLNFDQIRYLLGINKTMYIGAIIYLFVKNYLRNIHSYMWALNIFLIILNLGFLITVFSNFSSIDARVSFLSYASANYTSAISTICIPVYFYYFEFYKSRERTVLNKFNSFSLIMSIITIVLSGSRANILFFALIILAILAITMKSIIKMIKLISIIIFSLILVFFILTSVNSNVMDLVIRGFSVFESTADSARDLLWSASEVQFNNSNKLIGNGSIIVQYYQKEAHNFIWEILLSQGLIGLTIYFIFVTQTLVSLIKGIRFIDTYYILITLAVAFGIGLVQPFITTGYSFSIILWSTIIVIANSGRNIRIEKS